ncbi:hypothetical protein AALP_AAs74876U000100, partial [Arabis alpina]
GKGVSGGGEFNPWEGLGLSIFATSSLRLIAGDVPRVRSMTSQAIRSTEE